jgi:hypothetical protein
MISKSIQKLVPLAFVGMFAVMLSACVTASGGPPAAPEQAAQTVEPIEPIEPWDGDGMDIPLDGSSLEAFEKSMARVKAYSKPASYTTLVNAIDYLVVYDLAAKRDRAKVVAHIDGLTGREVIETVARQR